MSAAGVRWKTAERKAEIGVRLSQVSGDAPNVVLRESSRSRSTSLSRGSTTTVPVELNDAQRSTHTAISNRPAFGMIQRMNTFKRRMLRMGSSGHGEESSSKITSDAGQLRPPPEHMSKHGVKLASTIAAVAISSDDALYAAADMKGNVSVFSVADGTEVDHFSTDRGGNCGIGALGFARLGERDEVLLAGTYYGSVIARRVYRGEDACTFTFGEYAAAPRPPPPPAEGGEEQPPCASPPAQVRTLAVSAKPFRYAVEPSSSSARRWIVAVGGKLPQPPDHIDVFLLELAAPTHLDASSSVLSRGSSVAPPSAAPAAPAPPPPPLSARLVLRLHTIGELTTSVSLDASGSILAAGGDAAIVQVSRPPASTFCRSQSLPQSLAVALSSHYWPQL